MTEVAKTEKKKMRPWLKWTLIIAFVILFIVGIIAGAKAIKKARDKKVLDSDKTDTTTDGTKKPGHKKTTEGPPSSQGGRGPDTSQPASNGKVTDFSALKVGDKLITITDTILYSDTHNTLAGLTYSPGKYIGTVIGKDVHGNVKIRNSDHQVDLYIPVKKYLVNN